MALLQGQRGLVVVTGVLAVVVLGLAGLSVSFQKTLQMATAEQFSRQQLLLAKAQAANIQHYLDGVRDRVSTIARATAQLQVRREPDLTLLSNILFDDTHAVKKRIEFLDPEGKPLFVRGSTSLAGPDPHDLRGRVRGVCPTGVLMESDTKSVTIMAPVCNRDTLVGVVAVRLDIQDVAAAHLGPMKSGAKSYAWIMDGLGNLLFHPEQPDMAGRNLYRADASCFGCHKTFDLEKKIAEGKGDDSGRYVAPTGEDKIVSYSTASVGKARWIVAVSAPYSDVTKSTGKWMRVYSLIVILGFLTTSVVAAGLIVVNRKREQAEERARREATREMMHAEKLASLERLTSGIATEIGSPLTSIFSFVDVLMAREQDELKLETLETIRFHMNTISDTLRQLSRFSEQPSVELSACRVNSLIEDALALIQYDPKVQNITFVRDLAPHLPEIRTDKPGLSQVIVNIILRAADAMSGRGTITVRSRLSQDRIALEFEHSGVGLSREELKKIFDQLPLDRERGGGVGLSVSYGMVRRLGGDLAVDSEPGKGTRFSVTLPIQGSASPV
jgi:signal transduction histidine kinase